MNPEAYLIEVANDLKAKKAKRAPRQWRQPTLDDLADGHVFAFDQTFSKTGWALVRNDQQHGGFTVLARGFIAEPPIPDSPRFWDILQRTAWMGDRITRVLKDHWVSGRDIAIVHEQPILQGMRIESSLLGAVKVWDAAHAMGQGTPTIISKTHVAGVLMPPSDRSGKGAVTRALSHFIDTTKRADGWNEHTRDALVLAITYLYDQKQAHVVAP